MFRQNSPIHCYAMLNGFLNCDENQNIQKKENNKKQNTINHTTLKRRKTPTFNHTKGCQRNEHT